MRAWQWTGFAVALAAGLATAGCQGGAGASPAAGQAALAAGYPFGVHRDCDGEVASQLQAAGIAPAAVDNIWYQDERTIDTDNDRVVGILAYARLVDRPGLVVVDLTGQCFPRQIYTRDGLELPGVPAF
jgi:hypothetical protein